LSYETLAGGDFTKIDEVIKEELYKCLTFLAVQKAKAKYSEKISEYRSKKK